MLQMLINNGAGKPFSVQDIRALQRKLRDLQPSLRTEFMREVKSIGKKPEEAIQNAIPLNAPISRFAKGAIRWGQVSKGRKSGGAKSTTIRFRTQSGGKSLTTTLLGIRVNSAATSIADMAGRSGRSVGQGYRSTGFSKPFVRRYADGGISVEFRRRATRRSGEAFIRNLNEGLASTPSRMAWKAVEKSLPATSKSIQYVVDKWAIKASRGL